MKESGHYGSRRADHAQAGLRVWHERLMGELMVRDEWLMGGFQVSLNGEERAGMSGLTRPPKSRV